MSGDAVWLLVTLFIILKIFPLLSWIILSGIGLHHLGRLRGVGVAKLSWEVIFLEFLLGLLAAMSLGRPVLVLYINSSTLYIGVCAVAHILRTSTSPTSQAPNGRTREEVLKEESNLGNRSNVEKVQFAKQLEALAMKPCRDFVAALLKTFPPVHLPDNKWNKLDLEGTKTESLLRKLIGLYHPDKVDKEKYGETHYLRCQQITAQLNAKYTQFK